MKVVVMQSNYIPWKGYFDLIASADLFIFYDDVQYTKNDWRNRNIIKSLTGNLWLTIPCGPDINRLINEVRVDNLDWQRRHYDLIKRSYETAPFWNYCSSLMEKIYLTTKWKFLSDLNMQIIQTISSKYLELGTKFQSSSQYNLKGKKQDRLLDLLEQVGASKYITGPLAKNYLDEKKFEMQGIELFYLNYEEYLPYTQLYPPFDHKVSVLDLLVSEGPNAKQFLIHSGN